MSTLAIIPARGESKRIPRKNLVDFAGKPLIAYILGTAQESRLFEEIHVSTEDVEIAETVSSLGHPPAFMRESGLSDDFVEVIDVLRWVHDRYAENGKQFDTVVLLMATAPLVEPSDLRGGYALYERLGGQMPILAVARYPAPIEWAYHVDCGGLLVPVEPCKLNVRSQDITPTWYDSGTFAIFPTSRLYASSIADCFVGFPIAPYKAIDIDEIADLQFAEIVLRGMLSRKSGGT